MNDLYGCLSVQVLKSGPISNKPLLISNLLLLALAAFANTGRGFCHNYVHPLEYSTQKTQISKTSNLSLKSWTVEPFLFSADMIIRNYFICNPTVIFQMVGKKDLSYFFFFDFGIFDRLFQIREPEIRCHLSYNGYFLQTWMCVGVYSPQASWVNVIVFNALLTYP